jgi:hypothetical protein
VMVCLGGEGGVLFFFTRGGLDCNLYLMWATLVANVFLKPSPPNPPGIHQKLPCVRKAEGIRVLVNG